MPWMHKYRTALNNSNYDGSCTWCHFQFMSWDFRQLDFCWTECICVQVLSCIDSDYATHDEHAYYHSPKSSVVLERCYSLCLISGDGYKKHLNVWMHPHKVWGKLHSGAVWFLIWNLWFFISVLIVNWMLQWVELKVELCQVKCKMDSVWNVPCTKITEELGFTVRKVTEKMLWQSGTGVCLLGPLQITQIQRTFVISC